LNGKHSGNAELQMWSLPEGSMYLQTIKNKQIYQLKQQAAKAYSPAGDNIIALSRTVSLHLILLV
jgi:hypothetical protein